MNTTQLALFETGGDAMDTIINDVTNKGIQHPNYQCFVREVAAKALRARPGSLILCAVPSELAGDELVESISEQLETEFVAATGAPFPGVSVIDMPSSLRRRPGARTILESYNSAVEVAGVGHQRPPEFQLDFGSTIMVRNQFEQITSMIQRRTPLIYIVKNAHRLQSSGDPVANESHDAMLMLAETARQSQRTHIVMANTKAVLSWIKNGDIASAVSTCAVIPYDPKDAVDQACFLGVLDAYDSCVPMSDGDSLRNHASEIDAVVSGCPHRFRKWLQDALVKAKAEGATQLDWAHMVAARLLPSEIKAAASERKDVRENFRQVRRKCDDVGKEKLGPPRVEPAKKRPKPGVRYPNRNGVAA